MTLKEIFEANSKLWGGSNKNYGISGISSLKSYQFPYGGGNYNAVSGTTPPQVETPPVVTTPPPPPPAIVPPKVDKPIIKNNAGATNTQTTIPTAGNYDKYKDPTTGKILTPTEYANMLAQRMGGGDVATYSGNALSSPDQTLEQLNKSAYGLNNAANDISSGATDPYKVASRSGLQYSADELNAIEKAYAGVYDPALTDVFSKIEVKQKEAEAALQLKNDLEKMAKQNQYDIALKKTPTASESASGSGLGGSNGAYVRGENAVVDGWVDRLNQSGESIQTAIPGVKNQGLRDAVMLGLNASKSQSAKTAGTLDDINTISTMLLNPSLENISGFSDQLLGGMFGQAKTAKTQYNQIVGALQLAKAGQIKGQGQISDYERKVLKEASAAIDRGMNDEEFRKALVKLRGVLQTSSGLEAKVKITDPQSGQSDVQSLNTEEINGFIADGAIIEYLE